MITAAAPYGAIVGAVLVLYCFTWKDTESFTGSIDHTPGFFADFVGYYLPMGRSVFVTKAPVGGYFYSPLFAILLAAFAGLPDRAAFLTWGAVQLAAVAGLFAVVAKHWLGEFRWIRLVYCALLITSFPVVHNYKWGQVSTLSTLLVVGAVAAYSRGLRLPSALLLALSFSMKYSSAAVLLYFAARRDFKFLTRVVAISVLTLVIVPALLLGPSETVAFYASTAEASRTSLANMVPFNENSQYLPHVIAHSFDVVPLRQATWFVTTVYLGYAIVLLNATAVAIAFYRGLDEAEPLGISLLFLSTPFFVPTSWPHYLAYMPLVQVLVLRMIAKSRDRELRPARIGLLAGTVIVSNVFFFKFYDDRETYLECGFIFVANAVLLVLCYVELLRALRAVRAPETPFSGGAAADETA